MIDIIKLYNDYGIAYGLSGSAGVGRGWVGVPCPFCTGNPGNHLGYCIDESSTFAGRYVCWRCGGKNEIRVLERLISGSKQKLYEVVSLYSLGPNRSASTILERKKGPKRGVVCELPKGTKKLTKNHGDYLRAREFVPSELMKHYGIQSTGPVGDYNHRIVIPIYHNKKLVSYQGRDTTGRSSMKYKACNQELESREHKHCLYGLDRVEGSTVVVVEGVTDVWRLGAGAVATFGIKFKLEQVALLHRFKKIFVLYDSEEQAREQSDKLAFALKSPGREVEIIELAAGDPGEMEQREADKLMKELIG